METKQKNALENFFNQESGTSRSDDVGEILEAYGLNKESSGYVSRVLNDYREEWDEAHSNDHVTLDRILAYCDDAIKENNMNVKINEEVLIDYFNEVIEFVDVLSASKIPNNLDNKIEEILKNYKREWEAVEPGPTEGEMLDDILDRCIEELSGNKIDLRQTSQGSEIDNSKIVDISKQTDAVLDYFNSDGGMISGELQKVFEILNLPEFQNAHESAKAFAHVYNTLEEYKNEFHIVKKHADNELILLRDEILDNCTEDLINHGKNFKQNHIEQQTVQSWYQGDITMKELLLVFDIPFEIEEMDKARKALENHLLTGDLTELRNLSNNNTIKNKKTMETKNTQKENTYAIPVEKMESVKAQLAEMGIDVAAMEQNGDLEKLQSNRKTDNLYPGTVTFPDKETGEEVLANVENRLWLKVDESGEIEVRKEQKIDPKNWKNIFKTELTDQQKENLRTIGTAGELVPVVFKDGEEPVMSIVTKCSLTNQLKTANPDTIKIFPEFYGVKITPEMEQEFKAGKAVVLKDMITTQGKKFDSQVFYSADQRKLTFSPPAFVAGVRLTTDQKVSYEAGEVIYLEGLKAGDETFDSYVRKSPHKSDMGAPQFSKDGTFKDLKHQLSKAQQALAKSGTVLDNVKYTNSKNQSWPTHVRFNKEENRFEQSKDGTFQKKAPEQKPAPKKSTGPKVG
jgi:ribosomal protein L25 (general stress protein Ctc)